MAAFVIKGLKAPQGNDYATALRTRLPIAEAGNLSAQFFVSGLYSSGATVPQDQVRARGAPML